MAMSLSIASRVYPRIFFSRILEPSPVAGIREDPGQLRLRRRVASKKIPAEKYGGMLVLLAMDKDIAMTVEERMSVVHKALQTINAEGIETNRVFVDPLALHRGPEMTPRSPWVRIEQCLAKRG